MAVDVQKVVKECEVYKISKTNNKNNRPPMEEQRGTERAGQRYGTISEDQSLLFGDFCLLWSLLQINLAKPMRDAVSAEVIKFLETKI